MGDKIRNLALLIDSNFSCFILAGFRKLQRIPKLKEFLYCRKNGIVDIMSWKENQTAELGILSVIILSYNNAAYLRDAIDSALAIRWTEKEVIVVDDGSTDTLSQNIIRSYSGKIHSIFQENRGQPGACNTGFAVSKGKIILFLDSDDFVASNLMEEVAKVWTESVSKVQVRMRMVDEVGKPLGSYLPQFFLVPSPEDIRNYSRLTGSYPTPVGSGNIYARAFVEKVFPLDGSIFNSADTFLLAAAPFAGDVVTVDQPLVSYRFHTSNQALKKDLDAQHLHDEIQGARKRFDYGRSFAASQGYEIQERVNRYSMELLGRRLAVYRLDRGMNSWPDESRWSLVTDFMGALVRPQGHGTIQKISLALWFYSSLFSPMFIAKPLIKYRLISTSRSKVIGRIMKFFKIVR